MDDAHKLAFDYGKITALRERATLPHQVKYYNNAYMALWKKLHELGAYTENARGETRMKKEYVADYERGLSHGAVGAVS